MSENIRIRKDALVRLLNMGNDPCKLSIVFYLVDNNVYYPRKAVSLNALYLVCKDFTPDYVSDIVYELYMAKVLNRHDKDDEVLFYLANAKTDHHWG